MFGGYNGSSVISTILKFDTEAEEVTALSINLPDACCGCGCVSIGNRAYIFGGNAISRQLDTIFRFISPGKLSQGNIVIQSGLLKNRFNLINTDTTQVEIGVENVFIGNENNKAEFVEAYLHNGTEWAVI